MKPSSKTAGPPPAAQGWIHASERSNVFTLRLMCNLAVWLGRRLARCLLHPITLYFVLLAPTPRRHARRFLARVLGRPAGWMDVYRHFHTFATTVLDRVYLLRGQMDVFDLQITAQASLDAVLAEGRGAFLVGAHIGSFEVQFCVVVWYIFNSPYHAIAHTIGQNRLLDLAPITLAPLRPAHDY